MYKRFVLAGVIITCPVRGHHRLRRAAGDRRRGSRSSSATRRRSIRRSRQLLADVAPGKPQTILVIGDDRRKAEALQKHPPPTRSDTMILVRLDPHQRATALMSLPRDLRRRHPRPRAPEAQRRLRLRRGPPDAAHRPRPAEDPDPPLRAGHLLGLPRGRRPARLRLRRRRPQVLQRQQPAQRRRRALRGDRRRRRLPAAVRRGRAELRALPPPRQRPHPRRAPAVVPGRGQEPDRHRQRLLRPQGAAADLRAVGAHRHRLAQRDPLAPAARGRVGRQADPGGPVPGPGRRRRLGQRRHRRPARSSARSRASWPPARRRARAARRSPRRPSAASAAAGASRARSRA